MVVKTMVALAVGEVAGVQAVASALWLPSILQQGVRARYKSLVVLAGMVLRAVGGNAVGGGGGGGGGGGACVLITADSTSPVTQVAGPGNAGTGGAGAGTGDDGATGSNGSNGTCITITGA